MLVSDPTSWDSRSATAPPFSTIVLWKAASRSAEGFVQLAPAQVDGRRQRLGGALQRLVDARPLGRDGEHHVLARTGEAAVHVERMLG